MSCDPIVVVVDVSPAATVVEIGIQGPSGAGGSADISDDSDNQLTTGSDSKLFVPPFSSVDLGTFN